MLSLNTLHGILWFLMWVGCFVFSCKQSERPVIIQNFWRLIKRGTSHTTRISKSVLLVEDFEAEDAGNYICTAQNLHGGTAVATKVELN